MTHDPNETEFPPLPEQLRLILDEGFSFSGYERDVLSLNLDGKKFLDISATGQEVEGCLPCGSLRCGSEKDD